MVALHRIIAPSSTQRLISSSASIRFQQAAFHRQFSFTPHTQTQRARNLSKYEFMSQRQEAVQEWAPSNIPLGCMKGTIHGKSYAHRSLAFNEPRAPLLNRQTLFSSHVNLARYYSSQSSREEFDSQLRTQLSSSSSDGTATSDNPKNQADQIDDTSRRTKQNVNNNNRSCSTITTHSNETTEQDEIDSISNIFTFLDNTAGKKISLEQKISNRLGQLIAQRNPEAAYSFLEAISKATNKRLSLDPEVCRELVIQLLDRDSPNRARNVPELLANIGYRPPVSFYNTLIEGLGKLHYLEKANRIKDKMISLGVRPDLHTYHILVRMFGDAGHLSRSFQLLGTMEKDGVKPDLGFFTRLIYACRDSKQPNRAWSVLVLMNQHNIEPAEETFCALISVCGHSKQINKAFSVLELMKTYSIRPRMSTYNSLLDACIKVGSLERAFEVLHKMKQEGISPSARAYTILVDGCARKGDMERALEGLEAMKAAQIPPNIVTFTALADGYGRKGDLEKAFGVIDRMEENEPRIEPDEVFYTSLAHHCGILEDIPRGIILAKKILASHVRPRHIAYHSLIFACRRVKYAQDSYTLLPLLYELGVPERRIRRSIDIMSKRMARFGLWSKCLESLEFLESMGLRHNEKTFYPLFRYSVTRRDVNMGFVLDLLRYMTTKDYPYHEMMIHTMLESFCFMRPHLELEVPSTRPMQDPRPYKKDFEKEEYIRQFSKDLSSTRVRQSLSAVFGDVVSQHFTVEDDEEDEQEYRSEGEEEYYDDYYETTKGKESSKRGHAGLSVVRNTTRAGGEYDFDDSYDDSHYGVHSATSVQESVDQTPHNHGERLPPVEIVRAPLDKRRDEPYEK